MTSQNTTINVGGSNTTPNCEITSPSNDTAFIQGENIIFTAIANDAEIDNTDLVINWLSDQDGTLGSGIVNSDGEVTLSSSTLSPNSHTIQLTVEDEMGSSCSDYIIISVGTPPSLSLSSPTNGDIFSVDEIH